MVKITTQVTAGPMTEKDADEMVKVNKAAGHNAVKKPRTGREGQFMVTISPK